MRRVGVCVVAALLLSGACAPDQSVDAGMNRYSTDLVMGAPKKPDAAPVVTPALPVGDLDPGFPSFIVPSPPVVSDPAVMPPGPVVVACPQAPLDVIPPPVPADVQGKPQAGVYPFRQEGFSKLGDGPAVPLPTQTERVVSDVTAGDSGGSFQYKVAITQFGETTTTTYEVVRRSGRSEVDGIYIRSIVKERPGATAKVFSPVAPGLRIFALPASEATTWRSVATDPIHATTMNLEGAITMKGRVDACGEVVEGWTSVVNITVVRPGAAEDAEDVVIKATYVIAPQLGGLIVSDEVELTGTDSGIKVEQKTKAYANRLTPR